jgi:hypothetical protein
MDQACITNQYRYIISPWTLCIHQLKHGGISDEGLERYGLGGMKHHEGRIG